MRGIGLARASAIDASLSDDFATPFSERYVARLLGVGLSQLRAMRWDGFGPQHRIVAEAGGRAVYEGRDLIAWLNAIAEDPHGLEARRLRMERDIRRRNPPEQRTKSRRRLPGGAAAVDFARERGAA